MLEALEYLRKTQAKLENLASRSRPIKSITIDGKTYDQLIYELSKGRMPINSSPYMYDSKEFLYCGIKIIRGET